MESSTVERKRNPILLILMGHVLVTSLTWRDIRRRPQQRIRGGKGLWRLLSGVNTLGSVGYWLIGRRYGS